MAATANPPETSGKQHTHTQRLHKVFDEAHEAKDTAAFAETPEDYRIRTPIFEGPLDLLLHLIRKEQVDIHDIPVSKICRRYFEHLSLMQAFDIDIAGEFMVMAATLTVLKSQVLLPKEEEDEEEDPRRPLVAQLLEYERFKEAAAELNEREWMYRDNYPRPLSAIQSLIPKEALADGPLAPIDSFQLLKCLKSALDRTQKPPIKITAPHTAIREAVVHMTESLQQQETIEFKTLLNQQTGFPNRVTAIIVQFLAVLELARMKFIEVVQTQNLGPIQIRRVRSMADLDVSMLDQY